MKLHHYLLAGWVLLISLTSCKHGQETIYPGDPDKEIPDNDIFYLSASAENARKVSLKWDAAAGNPTAYRILRATTKDIWDADAQTLTFEKVGETQETFYTDNTASPKSAYFYKVKALYSTNKLAESIPVPVSTPAIGAEDIMYETYTKLATETGGKLYEANGASALPGIITQVIKENAGAANADVVLLMDNTGSMGDDIAAVKQAFNKIIDALPASARLGAGGFRDRGDLYVLRFQNLTSDFSVVRTFINNMTASGGGDIPEAMYDAIYGSVTQATWVNRKRILIVVSDAPPQEGKNTDHSYSEVVDKCRQIGVEVNLYPILLIEKDEEGGNG